MIQFPSSQSILFLTALFLFPVSLTAQTAAETIFLNGYIYTMNASEMISSAIAIKDDKIISVGTDSDILKLKTAGTKVINLNGKLVLPGFIDSHTHSISAYKHFFDLNLYGLTTVEQIQQALRTYTEAHPEADYIKGRGWSNTMFSKTGPDHKIIDEIISHIPVVLSSEDGHSRWVNKKALELAHITKNTISPDGGVIELDAVTGEPTGTLRESAGSLFSDIIPPTSFETMYNGLLEYQKMAASFGITGLHEASLDAGSIEPEVYRKLEAEGVLQLRISASLYTEPDSGVACLNYLIQERAKNKGELFSTNFAKIFIDGVVEGSTAYLHEPYLHLPGSRGSLLCNFDSLKIICAALEKLGFGIHLHSIGDAATTAALDAIEYARLVSGNKDQRNMITHLQLVKKEDIPRFRTLQVTAAVQPFWFTKDEYYYDIQIPYLGLTRADEEYPMKSFFNENVNTASSSDYPVTIPCNPLIAIETGITRLNHGITNPDSILWPEERVDLKQMLRSYTINGAYANYWDHITGSIEIGKSADFIVLDKNLFQIPPSEISTAKVLLTVFRGKPVFRTVEFDY